MPPKLIIPESFESDVQEGKLTNAELSHKYGRAQRTIENWRRELRIRNKDLGRTPPIRPHKDQPEPIILPAPEIKIERPKHAKRSRTAQAQVLLLSDLHVGRFTESYNPDVFQWRIKELMQKVINIHDLHELQHPISKLVVCDLGDDVQGEWVGAQMSLDEFRLPVDVQAYDYFLPTMSNFLVSLLQVFPEVEYYGVVGNHGRTPAKIASRSANWDAVAQKALSQALANYKRISFTLERTHFYQVVPILDKRVMITHGDGIKGSYTMPHYGIDRKSVLWGSELYPLHLICMAHWHSPFRQEYGNPPVFGNGALVTDDEWSLKNVGRSGKAKQITFGVHPLRIPTWDYFLDLT